MSLVKTLLRRGRVEIYTQSTGKDVDELRLRFDENRLSEAERDFLKEMEGDVIGYLFAKRDAEAA